MKLKKSFFLAVAVSSKIEIFGMCVCMCVCIVNFHHQQEAKYVGNINLSFR